MPRRVVAMYYRPGLVLGETGFGIWVRLRGKDEPFSSPVISGKHRATTFSKCCFFLVLSYQNVTKKGF